MPAFRSTTLILLLSLTLLVSCRDDKMKASYQRPESIPYPKSNPYSEAKYKLGKALFFDKRLSGSGEMACATCHAPDKSWVDGNPKAIGKGHKVLARKVPTILNGAFGWSFFWDGRAKSLEQQALMPIESPDEMDMKLPVLVKKLSALPEYKARFAEAFPGEKISTDLIAKAIATFERGVVSDLAPFDHWVSGDETAISEDAKLGFDLFNTKARCVVCHNGWNFTNGSFADNGLKTEDLGRGKIEKNPFLAYGFKTPTLRNIAERAPYMHDGQFTDLGQVIEHYNSGGVRRKTSELFIKPLNLTQKEKKALFAFLKTLSSKDEVIQEEPWRNLSSVR